MTLEEGVRREVGRGESGMSSLDKWKIALVFNVLYEQRIRVRPGCRPATNGCVLKTAISLQRRYLNSAATWRRLAE